MAADAPRPLFPPRLDEIAVPVPPVPPAAPEGLTPATIERIVAETFGRRLGPQHMPYGLARLVVACESEVTAELVKALKGAG